MLGPLASLRQDQQGLTGVARGSLKAEQKPAKRALLRLIVVIGDVVGEVEVGTWKVVAEGSEENFGEILCNKSIPEIVKYNE